MSAEEEAIKRKMMQRQQEAMQQQAIQQAAAQQAQMQQLEILKAVMNEILDAKAKERLSNLKLVKPDVAMQLEIYLAQLYQAGQIRKKITDQEIVAILQKLTAKPDFRIKRL
jgi:programmed cell death protein 5